MKTKTIRRVLRAKVDAWLATIEDEALRADLKNKVIVTGGAIASMLLKERVSDYDIYLRDRDICQRVAEYYVARFQPQTRAGIPCKIHVDTSKPDRISVYIKSAGIASEEGTEQPYEYFETHDAREENDRGAAYVASVVDGPEEVLDATEDLETAALSGNDEDGRATYRPIFMTSNAITLSQRVQIITRFYGEPDEIHANYDFVHCTNYWKSWGPDAEALVLRPEALEALLTRELRYVGSRYPICSLIRIRKFLGRGWTINGGQILKMAIQVAGLDLRNYQVLRDQLIGVDAAYFCEVLAKLREKSPEKIESAYLIEIIDRIF